MKHSVPLTACFLFLAWLKLNLAFQQPGWELNFVPFFRSFGNDPERQKNLSGHSSGENVVKKRAKIEKNFFFNVCVWFWDSNSGLHAC
jgi:hypothetical protein